MSLAWNTTERCTCGAVGDAIDEPLFVAECVECEADCCNQCGVVEGDVDGNTNWCADHEGGRRA